ncbi:MAG: Gfo/Idh/MocA family oxidoreductase [Verrucomicrobia bacterium]|nr:Gfo/Idh/MocA family oxidoreductase [Verrucomicrobiota bacterium]
MKKQDSLTEQNRRDFIKGSSLATLMMLMGGVPLRAEDKPKTEEGTTYKTTGAPLNCAMIGCGVWGRELLKELSRLPNAPVVAICDSYEPFLRRSKESAPKAETFADYHKLLEKKEVQGVFVATPSHLHKDIVIDALQAGKHVYCEAPLATTVEDARAIAQAAQAAGKLHFQVGQQLRSDPQRHFLLQFVRTGAMGKTAMARAQWHKKQSWRRTSSNSEQEKLMNWRLSRATSPGLIGEIGLHQLDMASWFINAHPVSTTGFGGLIKWNDGRDVPDTVQVVVEYPGDVRLTYDCTLANSFDAEYEMYYGTDAALMIRDSKAWMFKEVDSPLLGWEVYARKDTFYKENGIALVANATKLKDLGKKATEDAGPAEETPLHFALEAFISSSTAISTAVEDFASTYDVSDKKALAEYLAGIKKTLMLDKPWAGYKEGLEATVTALKANEAILKGQKVTFQKEWFELG